MGRTTRRAVGSDDRAVMDGRPLTRLLTLDDVAARLHVSTRTVRREIKAGRLRVKKVGRKPLVTDREFEAYVSASERKPQ